MSPVDVLRRRRLVAPVVASRSPRSASAVVVRSSTASAGSSTRRSTAATASGSRAATCPTATSRSSTRRPRSPLRPACSRQHVPDGFDFAFACADGLSLAALALLVVLSLVALGAADAELACSRRLVPRRACAARAVRAHALRPLRGRAHPCRGPRAPGTATGSGRAARRRDRDEDLPGRAPATPRRAGVEARGVARGADGARADASARRCRLPPVRAPRARGVARSIWRQLGRPLQIESLGSSVLLALHHAPACRSAGRRAAARRT